MAIISNQNYSTGVVMFYTQDNKKLYGFKAYNLMTDYITFPDKYPQYQNIYFGITLAQNNVKVNAPVRLFFKLDLATKILHMLVVYNGSFKRDPKFLTKEPTIENILNCDSGSQAVLSNFLIETVSEIEMISNRFYWFPEIEIIGIVSIPDSIETELHDNIFDMETDYLLTTDKHSLNPKILCQKRLTTNEAAIFISDIELPLSGVDGCIPLTKITDVYKTFLGKINSILNNDIDELLLKMTNINRLAFSDIPDIDSFLNSKSQIIYNVKTNIENRLKIVNAFDIDSIEDLKLLDISDIKKRYDFLHKNYKELKKKYPMGINVCGFKIKFPSSRRNGSKYIRIDIDPIRDDEIELYDISQLIYFERILYCCGRLDKYKQVMRELILTLL